jgi:hypothetical protein
MNYLLYAKDDPKQVLAKGAFDDDFLADTWARKWAQTDGKGEDYLIQREDGKATSCLFRTHAGQWYIMRQ